jgi:hypothetical protein
MFRLFTFCFSWGTYLAVLPLVILTAPLVLLSSLPDTTKMDWRER